MWPEEITEVMSERAARRGHVSVVAWLERNCVLTTVFGREHADDDIYDDPDDSDEEPGYVICEVTKSIAMLEWLHEHKYLHTEKFFRHVIRSHNRKLLEWGLLNLARPHIWVLGESAGKAGRVDTIQLLRNHIDNLQDDAEDLLAEFDDAVMESAGAAGNLEAVIFLHEQCGIGFPEELVEYELWPEETLQWAIEHGAE